MLLFEVEVGASVAVNVPLVIYWVLVAAVGGVVTLLVCVRVVGSIPCLTWAQKLLYHACKSCLSVWIVHSVTHTPSAVEANGVRKGELQKH